MALVLQEQHTLAAYGRTRRREEKRKIIWRGWPKATHGRLTAHAVKTTQLAVCAQAPACPVKFLPISLGRGAVRLPVPKKYLALVAYTVFILSLSFLSSSV